jgi:uncharacterized protein
VGRLHEGGRLEMLKVGDSAYDTRTWQKIGGVLKCTWVAIDDPDPKDPGADGLAVYREGVSRGAATFARLEGCWYGEGCIFMDCTSGGNAQKGQIWRYRPTGEKTGELTLLFESRGPTELNMPDNLCISPRGNLLLCEDPYGDPNVYIRGLTRDGKLFDFAKNLLNNAEFAGICFSPDGETLFFNIYSHPGMTLAVWGPWERGVL